jgi:hypothetical protein
MAWNAAMSLEPAEFEALELGTRHEVDLGQVLGLPAGEAQALLTRAALNLERALGAEVLARRGRPCPDRAEVLAGWITLTALDGPVRWSASSSAPNQVSFDSAASASQLVQITWSAQPAVVP